MKTYLGVRPLRQFLDDGSPYRVLLRAPTAEDARTKLVRSFSSTTPDQWVVYYIPDEADVTDLDIYR